jgi:hypothetical protein
MQVIIDHLAAVVIGAALLFVAAAMMLRSNDSSIESARIDAGRGGLRLLVDQVEQDFGNMGSGLRNPNQTLADAAITFRGLESGYQVLRFRGLVGPGSPTPGLITYRWRETGTVALADGTVVPVSQVERLVDGTVTGSSFDNVTAFDIILREDDLDAFDPASGDYHLVRYVDVAISMVSPLGADGVIEQTRWVKQFRPVNLNPVTRTVIRVAP